MEETGGAPVADEDPSCIAIHAFGKRGAFWLESELRARL